MPYCRLTAAVELHFFCLEQSPEKTQVLRTRLFSWFNGIETKLENGDLKVEHLQDMVLERFDTYLEHLRLSQLKFKVGIYQCLLNLPKNILLALTLTGMPAAWANLLEFKKREYELMEEELKAPGRELAYIVHINKEFA